jgi:hypothetical protein
MNPRRQRVVWLVALALVTAIASAPSVLTAFSGQPAMSEVAAADAPPRMAPVSGIAGLVTAAPEAARGFFSGLLR